MLRATLNWLLDRNSIENEEEISLLIVYSTGVLFSSVFSLATRPRQVAVLDHVLWRKGEGEFRLNLSQFGCGFTGKDAEEQRVNWKPVTRDGKASTHHDLPFHRDAEERDEIEQQNRPEYWDV